MNIKIVGLIAAVLLMPAIANAAPKPASPAPTASPFIKFCGKSNLAGFEAVICGVYKDTQDLKAQVQNLVLRLTGLEGNATETTTKIANQKQEIDDLKTAAATNLLSQNTSIQNLTANYTNLQLSENTLATNLANLDGKVKQLSDKIDQSTATPPNDFSFFTNRQFGYGSYFMSPAFDAKDYTKFSMTFTCTSQTNDEVKYWIETSADGKNWSPYGYYVVNCNGIYGGASINDGQMPARYFAVAVQQMSNNAHTNTITSVGRFSN